MEQRLGKDLMGKATGEPYLAKRKLSTEKRAISPKKQEQLNEMLIKAAEEGKIKRIERLLKVGADPNAKRLGQPAIHWASSDNQLEAIKLLVKNGADIEARDNGGMSAFMHAVNYNPVNADIVKYFIGAGADINTKDSMNQTSLIRLIADSNNDKKLEYLLDAHVDVNAKGKDGLTALMYCGNPNWARDLIKAGADVNARDDEGKSVLAHAAGAGYTNMVRVFVNAGATIDDKDKGGMTPLMHAALGWFQGYDATKALIEAKADINAKDYSGKTALMHAAENWHARICALLIERSADLDATDSRGRTALALAESGIATNEKDAKARTVAFLSFVMSMGKKDFKSFLFAFRECISQ